MEALLVKKGGLAGLYGLLELIFVVAAIFAAFAAGVYCGYEMKEAEQAPVIAVEKKERDW